MPTGQKELGPVYLTSDEFELWVRNKAKYRTGERLSKVSVSGSLRSTLLRKLVQAGVFEYDSDDCDMLIVRHPRLVQEEGNRGSVTTTMQSLESAQAWRTRMTKEENGTTRPGELLREEVVKLTPSEFDLLLECTEATSWPAGGGYGSLGRNFLRSCDASKREAIDGIMKKLGVRFDNGYNTYRLSHALFSWRHQQRQGQ